MATWRHVGRGFTGSTSLISIVFSCGRSFHYLATIKRQYCYHYHLLTLKGNAVTWHGTTSRRLWNRWVPLEKPVSVFVADASIRWTDSESWIERKITKVCSEFLFDCILFVKWKTRFHVLNTVEDRFLNFQCHWTTVAHTENHSFIIYEDSLKIVEIQSFLNIFRLELESGNKKVALCKKIVLLQNRYP